MREGERVSLCLNVVLCLKCRSSLYLMHIGMDERIMESRVSHFGSLEKVYEGQALRQMNAAYSAEVLIMRRRLHCCF